MRKIGNKAKTGKTVRCPKCKYSWKTKQKARPYICCSRCKRYFKTKPLKKRRSK